ncbi:MAG: hypothetical protein COA86_02805 [Kangiella sp.]|nr:MAG: hypothetical protein COA86_02805 [Kangiella sp.]
MEPDLIVEPAVQLYRLSSFSSFLEVAIALNLLSSTWKEFREKSKNLISDSVQKNTLMLTLKDSRIAETRYTEELKTIGKKASKFVMKVSSWSIYTGIIVSVLLTSILIFSGFNPDYKVVYLTALGVCILAVGPLALMFLLAFGNSHWKIRKINKKANKRATTIDENNKYEITVSTSKKGA